MQKHPALLAPATLGGIQNMQLLAKMLVKGMEGVLGIHASKRLGAGMEFSQYRSYEVGDDLRRLDWKLAARSGRYYVKQSETEQAMQVHFILDASASMQYSEAGISKFNYGRYLTAALGYITHQQGDGLGLYICNSQQIEYLSNVNGAGTSTAQTARFYYLLENAQTNVGAKWSEWTKLRKLLPLQANSHHAKNLVVLISDCYESEREILEVVQQLKLYGHEVMVLHLLGKKERNLDIGKSKSEWVSFKDLETGEVIKVNPRSIKAEYCQALAERNQLLKTQLLQQGVHYYLLDFTAPLLEGMRAFVGR